MNEKHSLNLTNFSLQRKYVDHFNIIFRVVIRSNIKNIDN